MFCKWFHDRKIYLDALENQLKSLLKATETMVTQRKAMAEAAGDFSSALHALSTVELSPTLSGPLDALSDLQLTIRDVYDRQAQQDVLTLGIVIEEYIRLIGSVKQAFQQRQRSFHAWHAAEAEMQKRRGGLEKLLRQGRSQQDRLSQVEAEVSEAEGKVAQARGLFEDMGRLMRDELDRFEREKVEDFKSGVETFLESAVEAQKEVRLPSFFPLIPSHLTIWFRHMFAFLTASLTEKTAHRKVGDLPHAARRRGRRVRLLPPARCPGRQQGQRRHGHRPRAGANGRRLGLGRGGVRGGGLARVYLFPVAV